MTVLNKTKHILVMVLTAVVSIAHSQNIENLTPTQIKQIEDIAEEIAKASNVNKHAMMDDMTVSFNAVAAGRNVRFESVISVKRDLSPSAIKEWLDATREEITPMACAQNAENPAFDRGLSYTFSYSNAYGEKLGDVFIDKTVCAAAAAQQQKKSEYGKKYQEGGDVKSAGDPKFFYETGRIDGVLYRVFDDRSGRFSGGKNIKESTVFFGINSDDVWSVYCSDDEITDIRVCRVDRGPIAVILVGKVLFVGVTADDMDTNRGSYIRIDSNKAYFSESKGSFTGGQDKIILAQMLTGKEIKTRYYKLPDGKQVNLSYSLYGFKQALDYIKWAYESPSADTNK